EVGTQRFAVALTLGLLVRDLLLDLAIDLALLGVACYRLFGRVRRDGRLRWGHDRVQGFGRLTGRGLRAEMRNALSIHPLVNRAGHDAAAQGGQQAAGYNQRSHAYPLCLWMRARAVLYAIGLASILRWITAGTCPGVPAHLACRGLIRTI